MAKKSIFSIIGFFFLLFILTNCSSSKRVDLIDIPQLAYDKAVEENYGNDLFEKTEYLPYDWWTIFNDEQLNTFIVTALNQNPTLEQSYANIRLAHANANRLRASLFPSVFWGGDISRQKLSETALIPFNTATAGATPTNSATAASITAAGGVVPLLPNGSPTFGVGGTLGIPEYFTQYETEAALTYNFDIWKKNQNTYRAALGEYYANVADQAFTRLQLSMSIAQVYYQLQTDYKRAEIAKKLIENQNRYSELAQKRKSGNLDSIQLVYNTFINVVSAKQALLQIEADIAVNEIQLKTYLAGDFDESIFDVAINDQPLPKVPIPKNLPLHLISNRPDVISQLWLIESAGKQIEVAKAGFYPDFNLTALFGYQTLHLHKLFNQESSFFNVDPAVSLPLFDGGRLTANLRASEVNYDLAIYRYNSLILNAIKEILDGLIVLRNADQQLQESHNKVDQQESLLNITSLRIKNHLGSEMDFLISQQATLTAQEIEIMTLSKKIQAILSLIKALGGGYENVCY